MLNIIWLGLVVLSVVFGVIDHRIPEVVSSVTDSAKLAIEICVGLTGIMVFWLGLLRLAEASGLIQVLARALNPVMGRLFPDVPRDHPAMGSMVMNIAANMLGVTNAATPFGLRAMEELSLLNPNPAIASNAMCTFLAINTSSVQLVPTTAIAMLAAGGASQPADIIVTSLLATLCSTAAGITAVKMLQRLPYYKIKSIPLKSEESSRG